MFKAYRLSLVSLAMVTLLGCTVGPEYIAPQQVANIELDAPYQQAAQATTWWQAFDDTELNRLVALALEQNRSLLKASANVYKARALFNDAQNKSLPVVGAEASYQTSKNASVSTFDDNTISRGWPLGGKVSWDVDLFGKIERATQAAAAEADNAALLWHDAQVDIISQVALSYGEYRSAQKRLLIAQQNLENLQQTRNILNVRLKAGTASNFDLARFDSQYYEVKGMVPQFRQALREAEATLSALLGYGPGQLHLSEQTALPELSQPVAVDSSQHYLRYRADVASAERTLAAQTANIGVVTADLYPNLSFSGFLGFISSPNLALNSGSKAWSFAPTVSWVGSDIGSVKAQIKAANASTQMALADFEQAVLQAVNEIQLSVDTYNLSREKQLFTNQQHKSSMQAMIIARVRYEAGNGEFYELLDAEREWLRSRDQQAQIQLQSFASLVAIYRVFGGGLLLDSPKV